MHNQTTFKNYLNKLVNILYKIDEYIINYKVTDPVIIDSTKEAFTKWNIAITSKSLIDYVQAFSYCALAIGLFHDKFKYVADRKELVLLDELKVVVTSYILFERAYIVYKESPDKESPAMKELFKAITNYFETIDVLPPSTSNPTLN